MDTFDIIMVILLFGGLGIALYYFLKEPGKILKDVLNMMKNSGIRGEILFSPIWFPVWIIDKGFKLNIFEKTASDFQTNDDLLYESERSEKINFNDYDTYIFIHKVEIDEIIKMINDFNDTCQVRLNNYYFTRLGNNLTILKNESLTFSDYVSLIQWISTFNNSKNKVIGITKNTIDVHKSFFIENDSTGKHINSLIGKNYMGKSFSVYVIEAYNDTLDFNNSIKTLNNFKFDGYFKLFAEVKFEKLEILHSS